MNSARDLHAVGTVAIPAAQEPAQLRWAECTQPHRRVGTRALEVAQKGMRSLKAQREHLFPLAHCDRLGGEYAGNGRYVGQGVGAAGDALARTLAVPFGV